MVKDRRLASALLAGGLCAFASLFAAPALASPPVILAQAYFDTFEDEPEESDEPALDEPRLDLPELEGEIPGGEPARRDRWFPGSVTTLPAPRSAQVASFATLNDLHFGEPGFGGVLTETGDTLDQPGVPMVRATDTEVPYWRFMNEDAISEINQSGVDLAVIKGDIADVGREDQFQAAARAFAGFRMPHHAFEERRVPVVRAQRQGYSQLCHRRKDSRRNRG